MKQMRKFVIAAIMVSVFCLTSCQGGTIESGKTDTETTVSQTFLQTGDMHESTESTAGTAETTVTTDDLHITPALPTVPPGFYLKTENDDFTDTYQIFDINGNVLYEQAHFSRNAEIEFIDTYVLGFTSQAGTGIATRWAVYCDVENSRVSETFGYVLMAQGEYVVCGDYEDGVHKVIVQSIFDNAAYYQEYILTDCSPNPATVILGAAPAEEGTAIVTYFTGEDYTETEMTIELP